MRRVAVIGAGPAGLVVARYLKSEGLLPIIFEQSARLGGQWSADPVCSGVWPSMRTNTSRVMTSFSDLPHPGQSSFPTNQSMQQYLQQYAERFGLIPQIRFKTPIGELRKHPNGGWLLRSVNGEEHFEQVVVASGRYHKPSIPDVPGLASFSGFGGVSHAFCYKRPGDFRGFRVLVAGCSISALEIASEIAMNGAERVVVTNRKQRYVLPKLIAGVPLDYLAFTRFTALAAESLPTHLVADAMKQFVLSAGGSPDQFGAPKPSDDVFEAGITQNQFFLPLVAEGRIVLKPWIDCVDGATVQFSDGESEDFDAIFFGTGYHLHLPFLSDDIRKALNIDARHLDLYKFTFHPELPGLAFLGMFELIGPYFPVLELQARWVAYTFSEAQPMPPDAELDQGLARYRQGRGSSQLIPMHAAALLFARAASVEPNLECWPELIRPLMFGPLTPVSFRMNGRDSLPDAPGRFAQEIRAFGCMNSCQPTPAEITQLRSLARARCNDAFSHALNLALERLARA